MIYTIIPMQGTEKIKLGMTSKEIQDLLLTTPKRLKKTKWRKNNIDDFGFLQVEYDDKEISKAIQFFEPSTVYFDNKLLLNKSYNEVKQYFEKIDDQLIFEDGIGFTSLKYQLSIYAPHGQVEAVVVASEGYYTP